MHRAQYRALRLRNNAAMNSPNEALAALRKSYERAELDEAGSAADPLQQFERWLAEAIDAQLPEPNAMTLATVGGDLRPSTRIVLIKGYDARGIVWYTNYQSRKGQELAGNPWAALQFHWVELERVVRIEGRVEKVERGRERRLLRQPPARFAHRRLGQPAERGDQRPRRAGEERGHRRPPGTCSRRRARRTGAATGWCPTAGSSGRAARAGCTTGCATGAKTAPGCASASRPELPRLRAGSPAPSRSTA